MMSPRSHWAGSTWGSLLGVPIVLGLGLALSLPGCSRKAEEEERGPRIKTFEGESSFPTQRERKLLTAYAGSATGALEFNFADTAEVRIVISRDPDPNLAGSYLLSVGPVEPVSFGETEMARITFEGLRFTGDGSHALKDPSTISVQWWGTRNGELQPTTFDSLREPCKVEISESGLKGSLTCPEITDEEGRKISIAMSWG